ncbi:MAG: HAD family hydrolase [Clostridiales bacterium]|nr:HAD family hydrolase [Clostridiales bacterium]
MNGRPLEKEKTGVIFDLDGTLWDSSYQVGIAWRELFGRFDVGVEVTKERMAVMMGRTVPEIGEIILPHVEPERRSRILKACCEEECVRLNKYGGSVYDGVIELLPELAREYSLFIVSNCEDGYIQSFMNYHGTAPCIKDIECIGRTGLHKDGNIKLIVERNGLEKAVYVGDTERDMHAAHSAGVPFIHAAYGFGRGFKPEYSIGSFRELPELLKKVFKE